MAASTRRTWSRIVIFAVLLVSAAALALARPWSRQNSFRQMMLFDEGTRDHNFRAMDEVFPYRTVRRANTAHRFARSERALPAGFEFDGQRRGVEEFLTRTRTTGLLVLKDDTILVERYFRGATADSPLTSWSVAKSVVSLLIGIAHRDGIMGDLSLPIERYARGLQGSDYGRVPVRAALTMSSGIRFSERYDDKLSDSYTMFARLFYFRESSEHYLSSLRAEALPGERFHYISSDTLALGAALRGATGQHLSAYLEKMLWQPLGMEFDAFWNVQHEDGLELAFCCLNVRLRDYAKLGRLVARYGDWDGKQLVPEAWIRESTRIESIRAPGTIDGFRWGYQYQWWIPSKARASFMAAGIWSQFIYVSPERDLVIVKTSVDPDFAVHGDEHVAFFQMIEDAL